MENNKHPDMRVQKTLSLIRETFEDMIMEMDYEKITVKELSDRARINRKTFYSHYPTIDDLLAELQLELSKEYINIIKDYNFPLDQDKLTREFFMYNANQSPLCERITCSGNFHYIRSKMVDQVMDGTWFQHNNIKSLDQYKRNLLTSYVNVTTIELYRQWVKDGKVIPLEEMIEIAIQLICRGVYGFSEKFIRL